MRTFPDGGRARQRVLILMICERQWEATLKMIPDLLFREEALWDIL